MKSFKEKIELIKDFKDTFKENAIGINERNLIESLSLEEVLSNTFEDNFIPDVLKQFMFNNSSYVFTPQDRFCTIMQNDRMYGFMNKLEKADRDRVYDKLIDRMRKAALRDFSGHKIALNANKDAGEYPEFLLKIVDYHLLHLFHNNFEYFIQIAADQTMTYNDLQSIEKVRSAFEADSVFKDIYVGYPLVIINRNISKEDKISIIKSTYRQKDLNKYTTFIRNNLTDLGDLDDFIEATILQNNRVRKKEEGFMDLIRRVFIGLRGEYFHIENKLTNIKGKKEFIEKYKEYFTTENVKDLIERSDYRSRENTIEFISDLFEDQSFEHKMAVSIANSEIGRRLFGDMTAMPDEIVGDDKLEFMYFDYKLNTLKNLKVMMENDVDNVIEYANKFPKLFSEAYREEYPIERTRRSYYGYFSILNEKEKITKLLSSIKKENIDKFIILSDAYIAKFGITSNLNGWRVGEDVSDDIKRFTIQLPTLFSMVNAKSKYFGEHVYNKYFSKFADEDFMNDAVSKMASLLNSSHGKEILRHSGEKDLSTLIANFFNRLMQFLRDLGDYTAAAVEGLEQARDELVIICTL